METSLLRNYATALYEEAAAEGRAPAVLAHLEALARALAGTPEFARVASHPGIAVEDKVRLLLEALGGEPPALLGRFLELLLERHGYVDLGRVAQAFRALQDAHEGKLPVRVECAAPLSAAQLQRLETALARRLGRAVRLTQELAPELIGGLRLHVDSQVLDASLAGQLDRLEQHLLRSAWPQSPATGQN